MATTSTLSPDFSKTYEWDLESIQRQKKECVWEKENTFPFDELILSWNGIRPAVGKWTFSVSVYAGKWSPWIRYAEWGKALQKTFKFSAPGEKVESYQDAVYLTEGLSDRFKIKVTATDGADLTQFETLFVCLSNLSSHAVAFPQTPLPSVQLSPFPRRSQLKLQHPRCQDLCSPTATSSAIHYLLKTKESNPIVFAEKVRDMEFDIYGNWILNTAQAFEELGGAFRCHVARLSNFATIHSYLTRGLPVIASVRGPLVGSYLPLTFGHLLCVIGYDAKLQNVLCIDSAFPEDERTFVSYPLKDFLDAWARRENIAYLFTPKTLESALQAKWYY
jgi:hypothetical protein